MRPLRWAIVGAALAGGATRAEADGDCDGDACSGGGGDGSSSSSSSSDGGGSYGVVGTYDEPACIETSDVHGRRTCAGFATWAMPEVLPRLTIEVGTSIRVLPSSRLRATGTVDHGAYGSYQYRMSGGGPQGEDRAGAAGFDVRILGGKHLYGGVELGVAGIAGAEGEVEMLASGSEMDRARMGEPVHMLFTGGAVVGARAAFGDLTLSGEVLGGMRLYRTEVTSEFGACVSTDADAHVEAAIEARGRVDTWLSPWLTFGAFLGTDLRTADTHVFGISFAGHLRAFDGLR